MTCLTLYALNHGVKLGDTDNGTINIEEFTMSYELKMAVGLAITIAVFLSIFFVCLF